MQMSKIKGKKADLINQNPEFLRKSNKTVVSLLTIKGEKYK